MLKRVPQKETESGDNGRKTSDKRLKEWERHRRGGERGGVWVERKRRK